MGYDFRMTTPQPNLAAGAYQAGLVRLHRLEDSLLLAGAPGMLVSAAAGVYALARGDMLDAALAWAVLIPFWVTAGLLLGLLSQRLAALQRLSELGVLFGEEPIPAAVNNPHLPFLLRLLAVLGLALLVLYGFTGYAALRAVLAAGRLGGVLFGLIFVLASALLLLAGWAVLRQARSAPALAPGWLRQVLLPDPAGLISGFFLVGAGWLTAWFTVGLSAGQLPLLAGLFGTPLYKPPLATAAALGLLAWLVVEGLLLPAGRAWQALRRGQAAASAGYLQVLVRLALALPLAYLFGGQALLNLALLIWLQLAGSALLIEPDPTRRYAPRAAAGRARLALLWQALLVPLRFFVGVSVWVGSAWTFPVLGLLFCAVTFLALGLLAGQRARAARAVVPPARPAVQPVPGEMPAVHPLPETPAAGPAAAAPLTDATLETPAAPEADNFASAPEFAPETSPLAGPADLPAEPALPPAPETGAAPEAPGQISPPAAGEALPLPAAPPLPPAPVDLASAALAYDLHSAPLWRRAGFLAAGLTALALLLLHIFAADCSSYTAWLADGYGYCARETLVYASTSLLNALLLVFDLLILGLLLSALLVRLAQRLPPVRLPLLQRARPYQPWAMSLLLVIAAALLAGGMISGQALLAFAALFTGVLGAALSE